MSGTNFTKLMNGNHSNGTEDNYDYHEEEYIEPWEYEMADTLYKIIPLIILVLGIFGNTLSFIVFSQMSLRRSVSSIYFRSLAICDTVLLISALPRYFVLGMYGYDLREGSSVLCKLHIYVIYIANDMSGWILSLVAVERCFGVSLPHKHNSLFTRKKAKISLAMCTFIMCVLNIYLPVANSIVTETFHEDGIGLVEEKACMPLEQFLDFDENIWPYLDMIKFSIGPFLIIMVCNICIIYVVVKAAYRRRKHQVYNVNQNNDVTGITTILIIVSIMYLLCTFPLSLYMVIEKQFPDPSEKHDAQLHLYYSIATLLSAFNSAINFFLYCLSGSGFRKELGDVLLRCCPDTMIGRVRRLTMSRSSYNSDTAPKTEIIEMRKIGSFRKTRK